MRTKTRLLAATLCLMIQPALASEARLSDGVGRWVCQPDRPAWPQVLIDFADDAYRRCDQSTCVTYPLGSPTLEDGMVHIQFAPNGGFDTADTGGRYREMIVLSEQTIETTGRCDFRGLADVYDPRP